MSLTRLATGMNAGMQHVLLFSAAVAKFELSPPVPGKHTHPLPVRHGKYR